MCAASSPSSSSPQQRPLLADSFPTHSSVQLPLASFVVGTAQALPSSLSAADARALDSIRSSPELNTTAFLPSASCSARRPPTAEPPAGLRKSPSSSLLVGQPKLRKSATSIPTRCLGEPSPSPLSARPVEIAAASVEVLPATAKPAAAAATAATAQTSPTEPAQTSPEDPAQTEPVSPSQAPEEPVSPAQSQASPEEPVSPAVALSHTRRAAEPGLYGSDQSSLSSMFLHKSKRGFPVREARRLSSQQTPEQSSSSSASNSPLSSSASSLSDDEGALSSSKQKLLELHDVIKAMVIAEPTAKPVHDESTATLKSHGGSVSLGNSYSSTDTLAAGDGPSAAAAAGQQEQQTAGDAAEAPRFPMIRKKSGEIVKSSLKLRDLARPASMPSTPSKNVHFDKNLEQIRRFTRTERPTAVADEETEIAEKSNVSFSWGGSESTDSDETESESDDSTENLSGLGYYRYMAKTQWSIECPNMACDTSHRLDRQDPVFLENVYLSPDGRDLVGNVAVKNIAFSKYVGIKYTIDYWKTTSEISAVYNEDVRRKLRARGYDRFTFVIHLSDLPPRMLTSNPMFFCIKYAAGDREMWDNNNHQNYTVKFARVAKTKSSASAAPSRLNGHRRSKSANATFVHSHAPPQLAPSRFDDPDFVESVTKKAKNKESNSLTSRYSFGASWNAGHKKKTSQDGERTFTTPFASQASAAQSATTPASSPPVQPKRAPEASISPTQAAPPSPPSPIKDTTPGITASSIVHKPGRTFANEFDFKPAWDSTSYQDFLKNYCFFQGPSGVASPAPAAQDPRTPVGLSCTASPPSSSTPSGSSSPSQGVAI